MIHLEDELQSVKLLREDCVTLQNQMLSSNH